jgi:two-component system chemotaxis response regulator CheY
MAKILIVDDSAFTRGIHKKIVEAEGHETVEAVDGASAVEAFLKEKPDMTLIDLLMPDMDGMEAVKRILEIDASAKIVICSTDRQSYRKEEAAAVGVVDFLNKPIDRAKLKETLRKATASS